MYTNGQCQLSDIFGRLLKRSFFLPDNCFLGNNAYLPISEYIDMRAIRFKLIPKVVLFMHQTFLRFLDLHIHVGVVSLLYRRA